MAMQTRSDNVIRPFILSGPSFYKEGQTLQQDAARSTALEPYTLMAKQAVSIPTTATADVGNTGDGTITSVGATAGGVPREGTWEFECVTAVTNGGVFKLTDPGGNIVANDFTMSAGAGNTTDFVAFEIGLEFTLTDGATDFVAGDKFTLAVTAVDKWVPFDEDGVGGAAIPRGIYFEAEIAAATIVAGDVSDIAMIIGGCCTIDSDQLVIEGTATLSSVLANGDTIQEALSKIGIFAEDTVGISSYEN